MASFLYVTNGIGVETLLKFLHLGIETRDLSDGRSKKLFLHTTNTITKMILYSKELFFN